jgi:nucleotide-binding universal stress UspA family protein
MRKSIAARNSEDVVAYKEIIVYLDPTPDTEHRLKLAIDLARSNEARLIGVDACSEAAFEGQWLEKAAGLADVFESAIREAGLDGAYRSVDRTGKRAQHYYSHYADLIIASQPEYEARPLVVASIPEDVLLTSGVPMLLLPYELKPPTKFENIVIAWKSSREAIRAVHDAMPLLLAAKHVTAFTFAPQSDDSGKEASLLVEHLEQHGVRAQAESWPDTGEISAVAALFACLDTQEADLIVAGAYGHSRMVEGLFGGVSHDLVRQQSLPVLLSH